MKKLARNILYHTTSDGMNIGCVLGEDAVACIDLPLDPAEARAWRVQIAEWSDKPIRAALFTAADRLNSEALAAMGAPTAVLHDAAFAFAQTAVSNEPLALQLLDQPAVPFTREVGGTPQISFSHSMSVVLGAKQSTFVDVTFAGGYAPDACFVTPRDSGVVFVGDHVAASQPPNLAQGNIEQWQAVLVALKKNRAVTTMVPGRGPVGDAAASVEQTLEYLKVATTRVKAHLRANRNRNDMGALVPDLLALYASKSARGKPSPNLDAMSRQVRAGLEHLYDELQVSSEQ